MSKLQIAMSEEEHKKIYETLNKAQGKFLLEGKRYTLGKTIARIVKEWATENGIAEDANQNQE